LFSLLNIIIIFDKHIASLFPLEIATRDIL